MVLLRPVQGLGILEAMKRLRFRLVKSRKILVGNLLFDVFVRLRGGLMASKTVSIYFSDSERKVKGGFGLRGDGFLNGLLSNVLLTVILLSLGIYTWP